jgi:hypothetical protein
MIDREKIEQGYSYSRQVAVWPDELDELEKNQTPPIKEICTECLGVGSIHLSTARDLNLDDNGMLKTKICPLCNGKKEIPVYYTPEQYTKWMQDHGHTGFELNNDCPVWWNNSNLHYPKENRIQRGWMCTNLGFRSIGEDSLVLVAIPGQPAPPKDYRP